MRIFSICCLFFSTVLLSCSDQKDSKPIDQSALQGSWKLVKYIDHANGGTDWVSYPDDFIFQKHLSPTHFTWLLYQKSTDQLLGIGGGAYKFSDKKYTEDIQFFFPSGSSELGQSIPFNVKIDKDGYWHHQGYAKQFEFDVDSGQMMVVDSIKIEEIWEKISPEASSNPLMGTWNLDSYRAFESDSLRSEYHSFVGYLKLVTPSHFVWIKYNKEGDEVMAAASGTYSYKSDVYTENIQTCYPRGEGIVGTSPEFDVRLEPDNWKHSGQV